jgi:hypothetical protein
MAAPVVDDSTDLCVERWRQEAEIHQRCGDYQWMAERLPGSRVVEVGCGAGFGTAAIAARGCRVAVIEPLVRCREWVTTAGLPAVELLLDVPVEALTDEQRDRLAAFAPDAIVCWLAGGSEAQIAAAGMPPDAGGQRVKAFREAMHRNVARLAVALPTVKAVHLVDRSAFAWQIRDVARDTLVGYHAATTFKALPFAIDRAEALYRRLDAGRWSTELQRRGGATPVLGSLVARRTA